MSGIGHLKLILHSETQQSLYNNITDVTLPHTEMTPSTTHVVHSGRYLMNTNAISAATKIK